MNSGCSRSQVSPQGCGSQPQHRSRNKPPSCCPGSAKKPQTSNFLPLSHLLRFLLPSPHVCCSKKQTLKRENLPQNSKISFKQAKNLSPFIIPVQPVMPHFHPLKPLVFSLLFVFFSGIFRCQHNHSFPVRTALKHLSVDPACSVLSAV